MAAPAVYPAINAIIADFATSGIAKTHRNLIDDYKYRSIDDIVNRLSSLLAKHRLCVLPRAVERDVADQDDDAERFLISVTLRVAYDLVSAEDGSSHTVEAYGEALDPGDKATAKAMSAAFKSAMIQTFCIPIPDAEDVERTSYRLVSKSHDPEPIQGWRQWMEDIAEIVGACESDQAIDTVQERHRDLLKALSRERPALYDDLGRSFASRRAALQARREQPDSARSPGKAPSKQTRKKCPVSEGV